MEEAYIEQFKQDGRTCPFCGAKEAELKGQALPTYEEYEEAIHQCAALEAFFMCKACNTMFIADCEIFGVSQLWGGDMYVNERED